MDFLTFLRAKAATALARHSHRKFLSARLSVYYTRGPVKNGAS